MTLISVPVSVGELVDKITILRIKNEKITDPQKLANVRKELRSLETVCAEKKIDLSHSLVDGLQQVNLKLWKIEDDIREKESAKAFDQGFIDLARAVYVTNDERFENKSKINELYGSDLREEKSYEDYR